MASLELEARLDNLLATAQEETANVDLFAPMRQREECPICLIPLSFNETQIIFKVCCGKVICDGCAYKHMLTDRDKKGASWRDDYKCPFCQQQEPKNQVKALKRLMKFNNPEAFIQMATEFELGGMALRSDTRALEMYIRAAELGHTNAFELIGYYYQHGIAVEKDMSKAVSFYEIAAKKESIPTAHKRLAGFHGGNENIQLCIKHLQVAACAGDKDSMDNMMRLYKDTSLLPKEDLTQTLRAHHASINGMKSEERDIARTINLEEFTTKR